MDRQAQLKAAIENRYKRYWIREDELHDVYLELYKAQTLIDGDARKCIASAISLLKQKHKAYVSV